MKRGRLNDEARPVKPADAGELKQAIGETRSRVTTSPDAIGGRLAPLARPGWLAQRAASSEYVGRHDLLAAVIAAMVAVRQIAPLVRVTFPRRTRRVRLICLFSVAALSLAAYLRTTRRPPVAD
jgi:hypothetical protein